MPDQTKKLVRQSTGCRSIKALTSMVLLALTGCFGAEAMHYDVQEYNKQVVSSEKEMLLYNIGALHYGQPPHFMMLSSVSQSRTFTGSSGFNWANPATWSVPFSATGSENPTIQFVPIQGQDFAQRFESPLTDKFSLFVEDLSWSVPRADLADLVNLFAQSLELTHGDGGKCKRGRYYNRRVEPQDGRFVDPEPRYYVGEFSDCVEEITQSPILDVEQIDGSHKVPTKASDDPKAADLVTALQAGYKWTKSDDKFELTNPVKIPAWFDYVPKFAKAPDPKPKSNDAPPQVWSQNVPPKWQEDTAYFLPKGYSWKVYRDPSSHRVYALVPDGYDLVRDKNGNLSSNHGHYILRKLATHLAAGKRKMGSSIITDTGGTIAFEDVGRGIVGMGIPSDTKVIDVKANTVTISNNADRDSEDAMSVGDDLEPSYHDFSYTDEVVNDLWPAPYDNVYVELRQNGIDDANKSIDDAKAKRLCFSKPDNSDQSNLVCGYFKIGNFLQIMRRLADMACPYQDQKSIEANCPQSIFGIADNLVRVPSWAENSAPYQGLTGRLTGPYVYVPAHSPAWDSDRAKRDSKTFFNLYKLYQMSLVDTSKLVTGAPAITISK